jgi:hypothetical protein
MTGKLKPKPPTRRDVADHVTLKNAGVPAHINVREDAYLKHALPREAGKVITNGLLAEAGTGGDDRVTLLTAQERARLKRRGGSGDRNPNTGLLQYGDGMGGSDNPGGGHNGDTGPGSPGSSGGYGGGTTSSTSGGGVSGYGANPGVGFGFSQSPDPDRGLSYSDISNFGGIGRPGAGTIGPNGEMDSFAGRPGSLTNYGLEQEYAPRDTLKRLAQTAIFGPPKQYNPENVKGYAPTGQYPGLARKAMSTLAGPMGPAIGGLMTVGGWMRDSMSPETQATSMAENQAQGAKNSTGRDNPPSAGNLEALAPGTQYAGTASGSQNASMPQIPPGYTMNPAGQIIPLPGQGKSRPAYQDPIRNLLIDYVLNGRQGRGFLG